MHGTIAIVSCRTGAGAGAGEGADGSRFDGFVSPELDERCGAALMRSSCFGAADIGAVCVFGLRVPVLVPAERNIESFSSTSRAFAGRSAGFFSSIA